eukprot:3685591-Pyramimonas_sp.AAC.1
MATAARLYMHFSRDRKDGRSSRASNAGSNTRRSASAPANSKKPGSKPFCFEFAKRSACARGD